MAKSTLSYGALQSRFKCIEKQLVKEKLLVGLLKEENVVQNRIIGQLKKLMLSNQTKPNRSCILGHKYCLVYHKRYNLVLTKLEDTWDNSKCVESESRENFKLSKDCIEICK